MITAYQDYLDLLYKGIDEDTKARYHRVTKGIETLRAVLLGLRWDDQEGYSGLNEDGTWDFVSTSLSVTPEELDALFALVGIQPDPIVPRGACRDCAFAVETGDGEWRERGYKQPCGSCTRPYHSNFVKATTLRRRMVARARPQELPDLVAEFQEIDKKDTP